MQVISGAMNRLIRACMVETHADIGFIGAFIGSKPDVTVNAHQRSATRLRANHDPWADGVHAEGKISDEPQAWLPDHFLIALFVLQEPLAPVISFQLLEKEEEFRCEVGLTHSSLPMWDDLHEWEGACGRPNILSNLKSV